MPDASLIPDDDVETPTVKPELPAAKAIAGDDTAHGGKLNKPQYSV